MRTRIHFGGAFAYMLKKPIFLLISACIFGLLACARSANTPAEIVIKYMEATTNGDLNGLFECAPPETAQKLKEAMQKSEQKNPESTQKYSKELIDSSKQLGPANIVNVYIDKEEALVTAEVSMQGEPWKVFILCQKVSGTWYVADDTGNWDSWLHRLSQ